MMASTDPIAAFRELFDRAMASDTLNPNAMTLATVDDQGRPWTRVVLLKGFDEQGFVFFTNLESRKGRQVLARPSVSLNFYWREIADRGHQVIIEGEAEPVSDAEADEYFATRPRGSQLGAWASRQSRPTKGRAELLAEVAKVEARYPLKVPRPPHWSGFRVAPWYVEFWREGRFRLHERTVYERDGAGWKTYKLFP